MSEHTHSHFVPCPACGTRFIHVTRCPICTALHSSYPHWVKVKILETDEEEVLAQVKFCSKTCAEQGVGQKLRFQWKPSGEYVCQDEISMDQARYQVLMSRLDAHEAGAHHE